MRNQIFPDCDNCGKREMCPRRTRRCFCSSWCADAASDPVAIAQLPKIYEEDLEDWNE